MFATCAEFDRLVPTLFACYRGPLLPLANCDVPANELLVVWHLDAGSVEVLWDGGSLRAGPGSTVLLPAGMARSQRFTADASLLSVRFTLLWPDASLLRIDGLPLVLRDADDLVAAGGTLVAQTAGLPTLLYGPFERTRLRFDQWAAVRARFAAFLDRYVAVLQGAGCVFALRRRRDPRLTRCLAILHRIDTCCTVPYPELQEASGLSRAQIDRLLRAELGRTPKGIIDGQCHRRACDLLLEPGSSVAGVASQLGFCDAAHFRRWFARHQHQSPASFRVRQLR